MVTWSELHTNRVTITGGRHIAGSTCIRLRKSETPRTIMESNVLTYTVDNCSIDIFTKSILYSALRLWLKLHYSGAYEIAPYPSITSLSFYRQ